MTSRQKKAASSHETIWIIGCGQFGRRAIELLKESAPSSNIFVVDNLPVNDLPEDIEIFCADGVEWFVENFTPDVTVHKIIPALPLHLAAEWLKKKLLAEHRLVQSIDISDKQLQHFPHPIRLNPSCIIISHADFICPSNCSEPEDLCTYTQQRRPPPLYSLLETTIPENFTPLIVRSRQFARGVGGFFPEDLWHLLEHGRVLPEKPLLIGTACKSHGIVDGLCHIMPNRYRD